MVQVKTETDSTEDLADNWDLLIASRARTAGLVAPKLVTLTSTIREFLAPFVAFVNRRESEHPTRDIAVVIPDLVLSHWYERMLHNNRGAHLRRALRDGCSARVVSSRPAPASRIEPSAWSNGQERTQNSEVRPLRVSGN